jgi:glycosyltransferase involved in cell wall biosynthesis
VNRVLFLAYHFPPIGGAGVQRSVKFVRHLPELGWEPTVITGPQTGRGRWTPVDDSLVADLPREVEVRRLSQPPPAESTGWRRRAERLARLDAPFARWWVEGAVAAGRGVENTDVIFASMSPFESAVAAARLGRELGTPWVADLRDPWALDEVAVFPTAVHRRVELRRMSRLLSTAAAVIMNTEEAARAARSLPGLDRTPIHAIPNGWDASDFRGPPAPVDTSVLSIVHTGYLHTELGLRHRRTARLRGLVGGTAVAVDFLPRSHVYLLRALDRVLAARPDALGTIELHLAGVLSAEDARVIEAFPHRDVVRAHGYVPHSESVSMVRSAGLLFLPMHDLPDGHRARIVPGKAYEYLASERPILAAVPDGDARDLMESLRDSRVHVCRPKDVACMAAAIERELDRPPSERVAPARRRAMLAQYERGELSHRLADVLAEAARVPAR